MKRYIRTSFDDDYWAQTTMIKPRTSSAFKKFMQIDEVTEMDWELIKKVLDEFWSDYEKFPDNSSIDSLDIRYSEDQRRFYQKYYDFAKKCKQLSAQLKQVSGYGKLDAVKLELARRLGAVDYHFPYGWKYA